MSSQKGNLSRTRKQKYQNTSAFRNDLHDKTARTKNMNSMIHKGLCERCKNIIEWKIKYKKYKPLTQPASCLVCKNKSVKKAYHKVCQDCAETTKVCAKCNEKKNIVTEQGPSEEEKRTEEAINDLELKQLTERKRRTVLRVLQKGGTLEEAGVSQERDDNNDNFLDDYFGESGEENGSDDDEEDES